MKYLHFLLVLAVAVGFCACGGSSDDDEPVGADVKETLSIPAEGGSFDVNVKIKGDWKSSTLDNWLTVSPNAGNGGSVKITAKGNESFDERSGQVTVRSGQTRQFIDVKQAGAERPAIKCPIGDEYNLVWHDEFEEGTELSGDWRHEVQKDHWVNNELQNYVNHVSPNGKEVTEIKNGKLQIHCFKEGSKIYSGRVYGKSNKGWTYGYVEASIKLPSGKGTWPAFWMMPVNFKAWPDDGEIDIMEEVGYHKDYVSSSLHATGHVHSNNTQVTKEVKCAGAEGSFHTYGMEWTKDYFQFYVDGKKTLYYANPGTGKRDWPYDAPFYVILNLAWGGDWGGSQGVDESALPITMEVDYVRVFQK